MKRVQRTALVALLTLACSPVYDFSYPRESGLPPTQSLATRLAEVLLPRGYAEIKLTPGVPAPMSGDSGAYSCPSTSVAIVSSSGAEHEARDVRALIQKEFSAEIGRGAVESSKRYRIVLE
jgi:hypothetical protein